MTQEMRGLFFNYINLDDALKLKGGRSAINCNEQEEIYSMLLDSENEILKKFGLPLLMKYREILFDFIETDKSENGILKIIEILSIAANKFLSSAPTNEVNTLSAAKENNLKTYDVLPEIGIEDNIYSMFLFEEIFKKNRCSEIQFISILNKIDMTTHQELGLIHYHKFKRISDKETDLLISKLSSQQIEYLNEFINYSPVYPY